MVYIPTILLHILLSSADRPLIGSVEDRAVTCAHGAGGKDELWVGCAHVLTFTTRDCRSAPSGTLAHLQVCDLCGAFVV